MKLHACGGTPDFHQFLDCLCSDGDQLTCYDAPQDMPACPGPDNLYVILPDYKRQQNWIPEQPLDWVDTMRQLLETGTRIYLENYQAQDYHSAAFSHLQVMGKPRYLHQEYILWEDTLLQARDAFYLPGVQREAGNVCAQVSNCIGTHRIFRKGTQSYPVLRRNQAGNLLSALLDFSAYNPLFRRPYKTWQDFFAHHVARLTGWPEERIRKAFQNAYPEVIGLADQTDPRTAVRQAIQWHQDSGLLRKPDGSLGIFEMIRSNDLGVRANLRTDAELLTAALFTSAGQILKDQNLTTVGINLASFLLDRNIQREDGLFKWFDHTTTVWSSDCSRDGLAVWQLYKTTGKERFRTAAIKLADALLDWLAKDGLCCGCIYEGQTATGRATTDNPVYYGEMVAFLCQLGEERYLQAAQRIIQRIGEHFPQVEPFGFSENFTYSRWLLMLASAQVHTRHDYSEPLRQALDFIANLQHQPTGAILEAPLRLTQHTEAGVAVGDGSDAIADLLYCDNFVLNALSILVRLPPSRQGTLDMDAIGHMYRNLKDFWMRIQIKSPNPTLNGGWMRAFDVRLKEYFGLDKDMDWGAYCIMAGWVTAFVPLVLLYDGTPDSFFITTTRA